jgi:hypothetical protein
MDTNLLQTKFARIGARLKFADPRTRWPPTVADISLDVRADRHGEFFEITQYAGSEIEVLDAQPHDRHLLLLVREGREKTKYLCGHDERHWFVAGIPDRARVGTVQQAKESLKPSEVVTAQALKRVRTQARQRRKNAAFVRQGEWFFLPLPDFVVDERSVLRNEPLLRTSGGKPHWAEFCFTTGGDAVYVCTRRPEGLTEIQIHTLFTKCPSAKRWGWRSMVRNAGVYVKGRIRHADHATIVLPIWHRVLMNNEWMSRAMWNVAFLD